MKFVNKKRLCAALLFIATSGLFPESAYAMHITEGILPPSWAVLWFLVMIPFVWMGLRAFKVMSAKEPQFKPFLGFVGAAVFIISCMPVPVPVVGATSHPCGTGLAAILIGPWLTALVSSVALTLQALFLAHGGITTLGANTLSMGVMGGIAGYATFLISKKIGLSSYVAAFLTGVVADWATYIGTSLFLALGLSGDGSFWTMFPAIMAAFVPTQLPLSLLEGFITAEAYKFISLRRPELLPRMVRGEAA